VKGGHWDITGCDHWASVAERPAALPPVRQLEGATTWVQSYSISARSTFSILPRWPSLARPYDKAITNLHDPGQPSIVREVIAPCGERRARDRSPVRGRYRASVRVGILQRRAEQKRRRRKFGFPSPRKAQGFCIRRRSTIAAKTTSRSHGTRSADASLSITARLGDRLLRPQR
jgi:hypothetical protein